MKKPTPSSSSPKKSTPSSSAKPSSSSANKSSSSSSSSKKSTGAPGIGNLNIHIGHPTPAKGASGSSSSTNKSKSSGTGKASAGAKAGANGAAGSGGVAAGASAKPAKPMGPSDGVGAPKQTPQQKKALLQSQKINNMPMQEPPAPPDVQDARAYQSAMLKMRQDRETQNKLPGYPRDVDAGAGYYPALSPEL